jgi:Tol biopolymer transport system component
MIGRTVAGVAALGLMFDRPPQERATILTVPQRQTAISWSDAGSAAVSADGRHVAFPTLARLVPADVDDGRDVYVLDRETGRVALESVMSDGQPLDTDTGHPRISGDGRYLVFEMVTRGPEAPVSAIVVVLRDRSQNATRVLTPTSGSDTSHTWSGSPAISADGRIVVFASTATDLVPGGDANGAGSDVYVIELASGIVRRISVDTAGIQPPGGSSFTPSVSPDGRYVAFASTAALDEAGGARASAPHASRPPVPRIYVRDTHLDTTRRVSVGLRGAVPDGPSSHPAVSGGGRYVAFVSAATNLVAADRNRLADVFLSDMRSGSTVLISRSAKGGAANGTSGLPAISADGRIVVFQSDASDLVCARQCAAAGEDINLLPDVFLFDREAAVMTRLSDDPSGGWMEPSVAPAIDAAGHVVAFSSRHPMDPGDTGNDFDLFVRVLRR